MGLAALLAAAGIAIKLPGHGTAAAIVLAALALAAAAVLAVRGGAPGFARALPLGLVAALLTLLASSIPFVVNGRVGILGVGLVNDDMASHLLIADWLETRAGQMPVLIHQGYPVGPHALVDGLTSLLGTGLIEAFAGLTLAVPVLTALVALQLLRAVRPAVRVMIAALVAVPYLAAAYLAQEAFKEPTVTLFLLAFALLLSGASSARRAIPIGVIAAGVVYAYSFPGLFWLIGTAALWVAIETTRRGGLPTRAASLARAASPPAVASFAALVVLTAPEWGRIVEFTHFRAFRNSALSSGLGNLHHHLSPLEALGIWPASDFRLSASAASAPAIVFYVGALVAAAALALGLSRWLRRHGAAVPAALLSAVVIYLGARAFGTVYTSAKALAIAAPLITLIALGGLLEGAWGGARRASAPRLLLALAFAAGAALSSFLVLRQAPVGPESHMRELAELRPLVEGRKVLFLGRDNFIAYELRGARPFTAVRNYYDPNYVRPNLRLQDVFQKFDFDSVTRRTLRRFPFVITTRAAYASGPPPWLELVRETPTFALWKSAGPAAGRRTLAEGDRPGTALDCSSPSGHRLSQGPGTAAVFAKAPVVGGTWSPSPTVESGSASSQELHLARGRWEISIQYDATRSLRVAAPGMDSTLPANLDYRGSVPFYPAGELRVGRGGRVPFAVSVERPPLAGRLLGTKSTAHLGAIAASPAVPDGDGAPIPGQGQRELPLRKACGSYLDWYETDHR